MSTTFEFGNRTVTATLGDAASWETGDMSRTYYDVTFSGAKLPPLEKLYEVHAGATRDLTVVVGGRTFGFLPGICADSKKKRAAVSEAAHALVQELCA